MGIPLRIFPNDTLLGALILRASPLFDPLNRSRQTIGMGSRIGYNTAVVALTSLMLESPAGVCGGAIFGLATWLTDYGVSRLITHLNIHFANNQALAVAEVASTLFKLLITYVAGIWALALVGLPITFIEATFLYGASITYHLMFSVYTTMAIEAAAQPLLGGRAPDRREGEGRQYHRLIAEIEGTVGRGRTREELINEAEHAGARLINDEVLAGASPETLTLFEEIDPSIVPFIMTKAIFLYSMGPKRNEVMPRFFKATTWGLIRALRQFHNEVQIAQVQPFITNFELFNGDGPQDPATRRLFSILRSVSSEETQGGLLVTRCYQRALELLPGVGI